MSEAPKNKNLIILLASIGHTLELYDYMLYGIMIPFLAPLFFPSENYGISLILGYMSFAIAFIFAPLGSIFWGWFGDKFGRQKLLRFSIVFMAIPALAIACLPTYQSIGILAPVLLIILRIFQGISASGEVMGSKIFAMEHLGEKYYGLVSGVISASGGLGLLLAMFTGFIASMFTEYENVWRIPFLVGFCIYFIGILIRRHLSETVQFLSNKKQDNRSPFYIFSIIKNHFKPSLLVFSLGGMTGVMSYTLSTFINPYLISNGLHKTEAYEISVIGLIATIFGALAAGYMTDKYKNYWPLLIASVVAYAFLPPILFPAIHILDKVTILACMVIYGFLLGSYATFSSIAMYKAFPTHLRCRGVLFNYSFGVGFCGGLAPLGLQVINSIDQILPTIALSSFSVIIALVCFKGRKFAELG